MKYLNLIEILLVVEKLYYLIKNKMKKLIVLLFLIYNCFIYSQTVMGWCNIPSSTNGNVLTLNNYNNKLIAGGTFNQAGTVQVNNIASFDGVNWQNLGKGVRSGTNATQVYETMVYNNELYAVGNFDSCGTVACNSLAKWDGSNWFAIGASVLTPSLPLFAIKIFNNELYVAGTFTSIGGVTANNIAKWDGTNWAPLGNGIIGTYVNDLEVYNNKLYAVGSFSVAGGSPANHIAEWDGTNWSSLGGGLSEASLCLYVNNNLLLIGGVNNGVSQFNGTVISTHSTPSPVYIMRNMVYFNNRLIAVGGLSNVYQKNVVEFNNNNSNWTQIGTGINNYTKGMTIFNNELYIGGKFNTSQNSPYNYIAKYCDVTTVKENEVLNSVTLFPNPTNNKFSITTTEPINFTLFDVLGREILKEKITSPSKEIDLREFAIGIYFAIAEINGSKKIIKLIKE